MDLFITVVAFAVCFFVLISVHEFGHFLAGWAGGIPARDMRIRLFVFPQHVVLRSGDRWLSPVKDIELYVATMKRLLGTTARCYFYVCGGLLMETLFSIAATVAFMQFGRPNLAYLVAFTTLLHYVSYLMLLDIPMAWRLGRSFGDFSALWVIAKFPTAMLISGLLVIQGPLLWYSKGWHGLG